MRYRSDDAPCCTSGKILGNAPVHPRSNRSALGSRVGTDRQRLLIRPHSNWVAARFWPAAARHDQETGVDPQRSDEFRNSRRSRVTERTLIATPVEPDRLPVSRQRGSAKLSHFS